MKKYSLYYPTDNKTSKLPDYVISEKTSYIYDALYEFNLEDNISDDQFEFYNGLKITIAPYYQNDDFFYKVDFAKETDAFSEEEIKELKHLKEILECGEYNFDITIRNPFYDADKPYRLFDQKELGEYLCTKDYEMVDISKELPMELEDKYTLQASALSPANKQFMEYTLKHLSPYESEQLAVAMELQKTENNSQLLTTLESLHHISVFLDVPIDDIDAQIRFFNPSITKEDLNNSYLNKEDYLSLCFPDTGLTTINDKTVYIPQNFEKLLANQYPKRHEDTLMPPRALLENMDTGEKSWVSSQNLVYDCINGYNSQQSLECVEFKTALASIGIGAYNYDETAVIEIIAAELLPNQNLIGSKLAYNTDYALSHIGELCFIQQNFGDSTFNLCSQIAKHENLTEISQINKMFSEFDKDYYSVVGRDGIKEYGKREFEASYEHLKDNTTYGYLQKSFDTYTAGKDLLESNDYIEFGEYMVYNENWEEIYEQSQDTTPQEMEM